MRIDQAYDPVEVEETWYSFWMEGGYFRADDDSDKPPFTIVIPPPNVTGSLHMGHALFVTLQDILVRWKRMQGFEALWLPGTDHAGIATQVVVERLLRAEGTNRHELGREKFLERVWAWKEQSGGRIVEQLKRMGASCDWERERFTMDEGLSHAVRTIFVRMYEDDLIYRGGRMVNWDPVTKTVLSNLEVLTSQDGEAGKFWYLKYPLTDGSGHIIVGTTRPETMLGDTAVAVHPEDERYQDMIGKTVTLPLVGREIPIIADLELPDPEKGTGAVKVTPAHDPNDFACGQRHGLELIQVIGLDATMDPETVPADFAGLDRYDARRKVVADFDALGLLDRIEDITYNPGRSERSNTIVEPLVMDQWFVRGEPLAKPAIEAVESGKTRITPALWKKTYDHFMYNIEEWCISRQLWWGHQIPAWYGPDEEIFVAMTEEEALAKAEAHYGQPTELRQDPDVLDTWFSSGLWPFSTLGWPEKTPALDKFYPTQVMETGSDILFFWVARMMMMGMYAMGEVPFEDVYLHAMVRDEKGAKMSKVKGNVIDPLHLIYGASTSELDEVMHKELLKKIEKEGLEHQEAPGISTQGADALRFTLSILASQANDVKLDISRMEGYRAFMNKLWNASKFAMMHIGEHDPGPYQAFVSGAPPFEVADLSEADRWMLTRLEAAVEGVQGSLEAFRFNDAAQTIYDFVWREFCDWYLECIKPILYDESDEGAAARAATRGALAYGLDTILRLLHPFTPFITEDIWQSLPHGEGAPEALIVAPWPERRPELRFTEASESMERAIGLIQAIRNIRGESGVKPGVQIERTYLIAPSGEHAGLEASFLYLKKLARIAEITLLEPGDHDLGATAAAVHAGVEVQIPLKGLIDVEEELARLDKALKKVEDDIAFFSRKLGNEKFVAKAPAHIVEAERAKLADCEQKKAALLASKEQLLALG